MIAFQIKPQKFTDLAYMNIFEVCFEENRPLPCKLSVSTVLLWSYWTSAYIAYEFFLLERLR